VSITLTFHSIKLRIRRELPRVTVVPKTDEHNNELATCAAEQRQNFSSLPCLIMTQLTYNHRSAFPRQKPGSQRDPSLSPDSTSEGDAHAYMARVRRNSHTGRRRYGSEQPEPQRNIRPKAATNEAHLPLHPQPQPQSHASYSSGNAVHYRTIPPPAQLVTSNWGSGPRQSFADAKSPESIGSPENSTVGYSTFESSSFASDRNRTLSPLEYTPTHSAVSGERSGSHDGLSAFLSSRKRSDSGSTNFLDRTLHHGMYASQ